MPTSRFCALLGILERTYRRWQAKARAGRWPKGPWPTPARDAHRQVVTAIAAEHPARGHRKIWAMARHAGHPVIVSTVLRILDEEGLLLKGGLPAGTPPAGAAAAGRVRLRTDRPELATGPRE